MLNGVGLSSPSLPASLPFTRRTAISTENLYSYHELKDILHTIPNLRFEFDDEKKSFYFENYGEEIVPLSDNFDHLSDFFYSAGYKHIFTHDNPFSNALSQKGFYYSAGPLVETNQLLVKADAFFKEVEDKRPVVIPGTSEDLIDHLFNQCHSSGLIVGEQHEHSSPKKFIIDNLDRLKQVGVTTLFIEHLFHETMQPLLEATKAPPLLDSYLKHLDREAGLKQGQPGFHQLVTAAKAAGIRVVAIDNRDAYKANISNSGIGAMVDEARNGDRYKTMNYVACSIIEKEKGNGKFIALVGNAHSTTCEKVLGLSEILGCPTILVEDAHTDSIQWNVKNYLGQLGHVHTLVRRITGTQS